jgi:hypothetical protein
MWGDIKMTGHGDWKMHDSAPLYALIIVASPLILIVGAIYFFW